MNRMKFLFGQRRMQVLLTLAVLLLAASVVIGSGANFTATSANAGNAFTAGNLTMSYNPAGAFLTTPAKMRPGAISTGTVTISNTGDVPGQFSLSDTVTSDTYHLGAALDLLITDPNATPTTVYNGKLDEMGTQGLGIWQSAGPTSSHTYTFTVTWPNNHPASDEADTALMGKSCTYKFDWTAIANSTID